MKKIKKLIVLFLVPCFIGLNFPQTLKIIPCSKTCLSPSLNLSANSIMSGFILGNPVNSQTDPINLYEQALAKMYKEGVERYRKSNTWYKHVYLKNIKMAKEFLAIGQEEQAFALIQDVLNEILPTTTTGEDNGSLLLIEIYEHSEMVFKVMLAIVNTLSSYPEYRNLVIALFIKSPATYGAYKLAIGPNIDLKRKLNYWTNIYPGNPTTLISGIPAATQSNLDYYKGYMNALSSSKIKIEYKPSDIARLYRQQARRLLTLAENCVKDNPALAKMALEQITNLYTQTEDKYPQNMIKKQLASELELLFSDIFFDSIPNLRKTQIGQSFLLEITGLLSETENSYVLTSKIEHLLSQGNLNAGLKLFAEKINNLYPLEAQDIFQILLEKTIFSWKELGDKNGWNIQTWRSDYERIQKIKKLFSAKAEDESKIIRNIRFAKLFYEQLGKTNHSFLAGTYKKMLLEMLTYIESPDSFKIEYELNMLTNPENRHQQLDKGFQIASQGIKTNPQRFARFTYWLLQEYLAKRYYTDANNCYNLLKRYEDGTQLTDTAYALIASQKISLMPKIEKESPEVLEITVDLPNYTTAYFLKSAGKKLIDKGKYRQAFSLGTELFEIQELKHAEWGIVLVELADYLLEKDPEQSKLAKKQLIIANEFGINSQSIKLIAEIADNHLFAEHKKEFMFSICETFFTNHLSETAFEHEPYQTILKILQKYLTKEEIALIYFSPKSRDENSKKNATSRETLQKITINKAERMINTAI